MPIIFLKHLCHIYFIYRIEYPKKFRRFETIFLFGPRFVALSLYLSTLDICIKLLHSIYRLVTVHVSILCIDCCWSIQVDSGQTVFILFDNSSCLFAVLIK